MIAARIPAGDELFDDIARAAAESGMHLIGNGRRIVASPIVPPGWFKIVVKVKNHQRAHLERQACAA